MKKALFFVCIFCVISVLAQNIDKFNYRSLPAKYAADNAKAKQFDYQRKDYFDLTSLLPAGYVKNGSVDYTKYLQGGLDKHQKVLFPDFPVLINEAGLTIKSNAQLVFLPNSFLKLKPTYLGKYEILRVHNVQNIVISNPRIMGDNLHHLGNDGQWGMGISVRGTASNIVIYNPVINECWGDGIYIGHLKLVAPTGIKIYNGSFDKNGRNGITITSGNDIVIADVAISNSRKSNMKNMGGGIGIEPSNPSAEFNNIEIDNPVTYNNYTFGIKIGGLEKMIGVSKHPINITIKNHIDDGSLQGILIGRVIAPKDKPGPALQGQIQIINPDWINSRETAFSIKKNYERGPKISISNLKNTNLKSKLMGNFKASKEVQVN